MRGLLITAFILFNFHCFCQELSYKQFTVKDGLPGSIVYHCLQDNNGFIWFATNQGVSRFDGRTFRNFSKEDGLPDNDILKLYLDKHNNIWCISLLGIPSVFSNNTIIRFDSCKGVRSICEDGFSDTIRLMTVNDDKGICGSYKSVNKPGQWNFLPNFRNIAYWPDYPILRASSAQKIDVYFSTPSESIQELTLKYSSSEMRYTIHSSTHRSWYAFGWPQYCSISSDQKGVFFVTPAALYYSDSHRMIRVLSLRELGLNGSIKDDINQLFSENDSTLWICSRSKGLQCITNVMAPHRTIHHYFAKVFAPLS